MYCQLLILGFLLAIGLSGQSNATDGAIDGYVTDASGSRVAAAQVTVVEVATNNTIETKTDAEGYFRFSLLRIGVYRLTVAAAGFSQYRQEGIQLSVGKQVRQNVPLQLAGTAESITVQADASVVSTEAHGVGEVLNSRAMRSLPIPSRNIYNLHLIGPGIKGVPSSNAATTAYFTGGLTRTTWSVDGIDTTARRNDRQIRLGVLSPESVEEMQLISGGASAEFGRSAGATISVVTRSGTNQFHGSGLFMYRPNAWLARPSLAAARTDQSWWLVAGNLGGPIVKDRFWFFVNNEYNPYREPQPVTITPANATALGLSAADVANSEYGETYHSPAAKLSFQASPRHSGFLRYSRFTNSQPVGRTGLTIAARTTDYADQQNNGAGQWAAILRPNLLSETRFGISRRTETRKPVGQSGPDGALINIQGAANIGVNPLGGSAGTESPTQISQAFTWTRGRHTMKAGADFQTTELDVVNSLDRTFAFNGLAAAAGRPAVSPVDQYVRTLRGDIDPATGRPYTFTQLTQQIGDPALSLRFNFANWFLQDEWRVSSRLTLSAGLRQEMLFFPVIDQQAPFELSRRVRNSTNNFAPRAGFAWQPDRRGRTAIRGSYGLFYDTPSLNLFINGGINNGRRVSTLVVPGSDARSPRFPALFTGTPGGLQTAPSITAFSGDYRPMYGHNANLTVQRELHPNLSLSAQYGFWGHRFGLYTRDVNLGAPIRFLADGRPVFQGARGRPDARFNAINLLESGGNSSYHGLDVTLRQRFASGLQFSATWSWSHALGDSDQQGGSLTDPTNRRLDYGNLSGDVRHNLNFAALYALRTRWAGLKFLNGFELSGIGFWNSGYPIDPRAGIDLNGDLTLNDRNIGAGRNARPGPQFLQFDLRLTRRIRLREKHSLELMLEGDNVFNRLNANCTAGCTGVVVNREGAPDFGRITTARTARRLQAGVRYSF